MKRQKMATDFLHTSTIQAQSAIFIISESRELYTPLNGESANA